MFTASKNFLFRIVVYDFEIQMSNLIEGIVQLVAFLQFSLQLSLNPC